MGKLEEFLDNLPEASKRFLQVSREASRKHFGENYTGHMIESYILLDGEVFKTDLTVAILWQMQFPEDIRVARDMTPLGDVSTVFITIPLPANMHFETMVFGEENARVERRYATLEEAQKGHAAIVQKCGGIR
jgi:hypothetical protein